MPKQYGSNGINSDGSLMNVGNNIWDPNNGGRPSIRMFPEKSAMARSTPPWLLDESNTPQKKNNINNSEVNSSKTQLNINQVAPTKEVRKARLEYARKHNKMTFW